MKERYIDIVEQAVKAYSKEKIASYIQRVEKEGIQEHGFPRLTANFGTLVALGRRPDLKEFYLHMMDLCTEQIPRIKKTNGDVVGNDFSVREIVFSLLEAEKSGMISEAQCKIWRENLSRIQPYETYSCLVLNSEKRYGNWAQFAATSEVLRKYAGIGSEDAFIDRQISSQVPYFDENGFYRDPNEPMLYELMTRLQMAMALYFGYRGQYYDVIYENLMKTAMPTLYMQSVTGELAYGGRSNQFLFNEAAIAAMCEFYASEFYKLGDPAKAGLFKRAAHLASDSIFKWLNREDVHHIKNCFPSDSTHGCEGYAYFNKYMVTLGSNIYCAYVMADDSIGEAAECPAETGVYSYQTGEYFHKVFLNSGKIFAEIDYRADYHYDASGLGRIHFAGAPSALAANLPFTTHSVYSLELENPYPLSLCGGNIEDGTLSLGSDPQAVYAILDHGSADKCAFCRYSCQLPNGKTLRQCCAVDQEKAVLTTEGEGTVLQVIPVFSFDGHDHTEIEAGEQWIRVRYMGFECCFETDGSMKSMHQEFANRTGYYQGWYAERNGSVEVRVTIRRIEENTDDNQ